MDRRCFLKTAALGLAGLCLPANPWTASQAQAESPAEAAFRVADAHAHPKNLLGAWDYTTPSLETLGQAGVSFTVAAVVGDRALRRRDAGDPKSDAANHLDRLASWYAAGQARPILGRADLDAAPGGAPVGIIAALEGGDPLNGQLDNLDYFHEKYGVRLITLLHDTTNEIGDHQRANPNPAGLSSFGRGLVERMNRLGVVVDVAHAQMSVVKDVAEVSGRPIVDSHTNLSQDGEHHAHSRARGWQEMEMVARTGGVVCTWPLARKGRTTLADWAAETVLIKQRLGIEHVGLGTDGGGGLPKLVEGWKSIADWPALASALQTAGLTKEEIQAYLYGNLLRVLRANLS